MDDGLRFAIREGGRTLARALLLKFWANYTLISFELKGRFGALFAARNLSSKYLVEFCSLNYGANKTVLL